MFYALEYSFGTFHRYLRITKVPPNDHKEALIMILNKCIKSKNLNLMHCSTFQARTFLKLINTLFIIIFVPKNFFNVSFSVVVVVVAVVVKVYTYF